MATNYRAEIPKFQYNPNPEPQPNFIDPAVRGYIAGDELARKREAAEQKRFIDAMGILTDKSVTKILSKDARQNIMRTSIIPGLNKNFGLGIDPSQVSVDDGDTDFDKILSHAHYIYTSPDLTEDQKRSHMDIIKWEFANLLSKADEEELPRLKMMQDVILPKKKERSVTPHMIQRITPQGEFLYQAVNDDGETYVAVRRGNSPNAPLEPYSGATMPMSQNPSPGEAQRMVELVQARNAYSDALDAFDPKIIGILKSRYANMRQYFDADSEAYAKFSSLAGLATTVIRHKFFGSQLTDREMASWEALQGTDRLSPEAFYRHLKTIESSLGKMTNAAMDVSRAANRPFNEELLAPTPRKPRSMDSDQSVVIIDPAGVEHQILRSQLKSALKKYPGTRLKK